MTTDVLEPLHETLKFLREHNSRGTPVVQLKILLRSKTTEISKALNGFLNTTDIQPEEKLDQTIDALGVVNEIEMEMPSSSQLEMSRIKMAAIANFLRNHLVQFFSHSNIARNYSSASILSNLLMDNIIQLDEVPELAPYSEPENFNRSFGPAFNIIVSSCGVYTSLISALPILNREYIDTWFDQIFKYMWLYEQLRERFNILALLSTGKVREPEKLLYNAYNIANTHFTMIENMIQAFKIYDRDFPDLLLDNEVLPTAKLNDIKVYVENIIRSNDKISLDIEEAKKKRWLSPNVDISETPVFQHFQLNSDLVQSLLVSVELYQTGMFGKVHLVENLLGTKLDRINKFLELTGSKAELMNSSAISMVVEEFKDIIPFTALLSVEKNNSGIFFDFIRDWEIFFDMYTFENANEIAFLLLLSSLFVKTKLNLEIDFYDISEKIEQNIEFVSLRPRLFNALSVIKIISDTYLGKIGLTRAGILDHITEIGLPEHDSWYQEELDRYLDYLWGDGTLTELNHRKELVPMDVYSWLIPDFTNINFPKGLSLEYLPFNLRRDVVI